MIKIKAQELKNKEVHMNSSVLYPDNGQLVQDVDQQEVVLILRFLVFSNK